MAGYTPIGEELGEVSDDPSQMPQLASNKTPSNSYAWAAGLAAAETANRRELGGGGVRRPRAPSAGYSMPLDGRVAGLGFMGIGIPDTGTGLELPTALGGTDVPPPGTPSSPKSTPRGDPNAPRVWTPGTPTPRGAPK